MIAPSGKQITIVAKDQQAVVVEVGGGLRSYSVGGRELLDGYSADEMSSSGRGQVLIPWPNRLEDGLPPMVVNALREWQLASHRSGSDLVFPGDRDRPLALTTIIRHVWHPAQIAARIVTNAGRPKYSGIHALRHFYASWCINRRADGGLELPIKVVQGRLGHASIQMTADRYGHLFPRSDDTAELAAAERAFFMTVR